jgi:restriction endonuclease
MPRYFKIICLDDPKWLLEEFHQGRARFGWSGPGTDLREIRQKEWTTRTEAERVAWSYTKFLIERICPGDRIVVQPDQPIQRFVIGEVIDPGYESSPGTLPDFNHILHVNPLTPQPIPINATVVSAALKHDLSKRGHYYEIYPEQSIQELDLLAQNAQQNALDLTSIRTDENTRDRTLQAIKKGIIAEVSRLWPSKDFERLCEVLCDSLDYIEVKERKDGGRGWDLLVRIVNPITQTILLDDVPVQCKNYTGPVTSTQPIDDLERCIRNSDADTRLAILFILGDLTPEFRLAVQAKQETLSQELKRGITFEVIDQDRIAELYARYIGDTVNRVSGAV